MMLLATAALAAPKPQVQLFSLPEAVCAGELADLEVRIKFHQDIPLVVDELAIVGEGGQFLGQATLPTVARRNDHWYYYTFFAVDVSAFDANGDGTVEVVAMATVHGDAIISVGKEIHIGPPEAPSQPVPAHGANLATAPLALDWADTAGAEHYNVYLDDALVASHLESSRWTVNVPIAPGPQTWVVEAVNHCGSTVGPTWQFRVLGCTAAPGIPAGPVPANNATLTNPPIILNWADAPGATSYDVILDGVVVATGLTASQWTCNVVIGPGVHTWQVIARNACGSTTGPLWRFTVAGCLTPAAPSTPSPANNAVLAAAPTVLDWTDAARATSYDVYLNGVLAASSLSESHWFVDVAVPNGTNVWYVVARNDCGETRGPNWRFILQGCLTPAVPCCPHPSNNVVLATAPTFLDWADAARATSYDVYLNGALAASYLFESHWFVDVAVPNGTNLWYVVARNDCGETRGPNWRFILQGCLAPAVPCCPSPSNNVVVATAPAVLNWSDAARATSYDVYLNGLLVASDLFESHWSVDVAIPNGTNVWYVVARNDCGETRGPTWRFVLRDCLLPATPASPNPTNNAFLATAPTVLNWADTARATSYDVYLNGELVAFDLFESHWFVDVIIPTGTNFWFVIARNDCGETVGPIWRFIVQPCVAPGTPAGPTPAHGVLLTEAPILFNWADTARAASYDVFLNGVLVAAGLTGSQWHVDVTIPRGTNCWFVVAHNDCGDSKGPDWCFVLRDCLLPGAPVGPNPTNGAILGTTPVILNWADAAGATSYDVYLNGALVAFDLTESQWYVDVAIPIGTNFWYVVARNDCGETRGLNWRFVLQACQLPGTPAAPSPAHGATVSTVPTLLNWADTARATSYDVYLNGIPVALDLAESQWFVDVIIPTGTNFWFVIARNDCGETVGPIWRFNVQACLAPAVPASSSPAHGAVLTTVPALLNWADTARATSYDVYLNGALVAFEITESHWFVDVPIAMGTNVWYVVARNACGETRGPNWRFTVQACLPPGTPASPIPANGAVLTDPPLTLNWGDVARATSYDVVLDGNVVATGLTVSQWSCDVVIAPGPHTWFVITRNACGETVGPLWSFTVSCSRPAAPSGPSPAHNSTLSSSPTKLNWADALRATSYDLIVDGVLVATGLTVSEWPCGNFANGLHTWQVIARNACGATTGAVWRFTVSCSAPATPSSPSPANGAKLTSAPVKLNWANTARAASYDVYLDGVLVASDLRLSEWTIDRHLARGVTHTWYVVAKNSCGSTRGPQWSFRIGNISSGSTTDD